MSRHPSNRDDPVYSIMKLAERIETTHARVFKDEDGPELIEQFFSDGSSIVMHAQQHHAISVAAARIPTTVLQAYS